MKKFSILFIAFLMLFSANVFAESYNLSVGGRSVTDENKNDIVGYLNQLHSDNPTNYPATATGVITYNSATNTLTLNAATINVQNASHNYSVGINNQIANLTINLIGTNTITTYNTRGIVIASNAKITGSGSLEVVSNYASAIEVYNANLTIENTTVTARSNNYKNTILGTSGNASSSLTIINSTLRAYANANTNTDVGGTIYNFIGGITLNNCAITQPAGASTSNGVSNHSIYNANGNVVKTDVVIEPFVSYDLWVAGVQVTDVNKTNITGTGISGSVNYNSESNTLTLNNATLNVTNNTVEGVKNQISNLRINLIGNNSITTNHYGISSMGKFTITSSGSLNVRSNDSDAIVCSSGNIGEDISDGLTIENTSVTATGKNCGISGYNGASGITIINSVVRASCTNTSESNRRSIGYISSLTLNGCIISQPAGAVFNATQKAVCLNGERVTTEVIIAPAYNLWVAGVQVTTANKNNITGTDISGSVSYNSETNTLTLNAATISTSAICIENSIANLTINLVGGNSLSSPVEDAMKLNASTKITGSGTLTATSPKAAIWHRVDTLTIENTDVTLNGENTGIGGGNRVVRINNSTVRATGANNGSIVSVTNLILNDCFISQPEGAVFNASQKAVVDANGYIVKTEVVIEPIIYYNLWVADVQVSNANKNNITGTDISGSVSYNSETKTLTLNAATISTSAIGIENSIANLTINLLGENSLISPIEDAMKFNASTKITGSGTLTATSPKAAIWHRVGTLTIENTDVTLNGENVGISGGNVGVLSINNSTVRATGTNNGSIQSVNSLALSGCAITQPEGAIFDTGQRAVCVNGEIVTTEIVIEPGIVPIHYHLYVAGVQINDANKDDISAAVVDAGHSASGAITFDPTSNTLTLEDANFSTSAIGIENSIANLTINLVGENSLTSTLEDAMKLNASTKITGSGTLTATSPKAAIWHRVDTLTIENTDVTLNGENTGIGGNNNVVSINNSIVRATGTNDGSIKSITNLLLNGCAITQPTGAIFDASQKAVYLNGTLVKTEVVIEPPVSYNLYVAGVQVTTANKYDISAAVVAAGHTATGAITYDPTSNTLTLEDATITVTTNDLRAIQSFIPDLTLELIGQNNVTAKYHSICFETSATITGNGSLTVTSTDKDALFHSNCNLTIENTSVTANGANFGIRGYNGNNEVLSITNSTVRATATNTASIGNINSLVLNGCAIVQPTGAVFNAVQKGVCLNGIKVKTEVVIEPAITYTVSGTVLDNENNPLANVEIAYNDGTTTTAADGTYSFTTIENTTYTVTPSKIGCSFEPATATVNVVDADVIGVDFVGTEGEIYDLYVAGVQVTTANKNDITAAVVAVCDTATGTITYNPESNVLTLNNATLNVTGNNVVGIKNQIPNLRINLIGENTITADYRGIWSYVANFTITGTGSLTTNAGDIGIYSSGCNLTIENTTVTANGSDWGGICGNHISALIITNSTVRATGTNIASITDIGNLVLNGCEITQPVGAIFDASQHAVCLNGERVKTEVVIEPPVSYNLYVADVQVNYANKYNITAAVVAAEHTATGAITYDPTSNVLTLDNATLNVTNHIAIYNLIENLTINLIGENSITATNTSGIYSTKNITITGNGSLTINVDNYGIYLEHCSLTIENTTITATGNFSGICGAYGNNEVLSITNSTVKATGTNYSSIAYMYNLILNGCAITQPAGAEFNASQKAVCLNGTKVKTEVVIEPGIAPTYYDLYVAGIRVSELNKDNITSAVVAAGQTASGTITYDPTTNTLTLDNASISATNDGIDNPIENLTINLIGENTINTEYIGIYSNADFTITGNGSLTINANDAIYCRTCNLTIENTTITATGQTWGIRGYNGNNEVLTITNSTVRATGTNWISIGSIGNLVLNGCDIFQPVSAKFNATQKAVCYDYGNIVKGYEVVIEPGIAPTTYTVSGTILDNENNPLANVEIAYNGGITTTAADGTYSFTAYENTTHTVTPSKFAYTFEPVTATVNVVDADVTGQDFLGTAEDIYDLYVANVQVTDANKDNISAAVNQLGNPNISASGSVSYDPVTNTLTLEDANINSDAYSGIENEIPNLTINLIGNNSITTNYDGIYSFQADFTITGNGSLTINANYGIYIYHCNLTIENTTITTTGNAYGIRGNSASSVLTITNSTVRATGTNTASIGKINNLVLNGCAIIEPANAVFDNHSVCLNGNIVTTEVVIAAFPTISVSDATACDSYTLPTSETSDTWIWTNENNETVTDVTESGVYTVVATNEFGCTATENITVTINQSVTNEITETACGSFEWNGTTYNASGDYSETFTAENGCDSIVTLHLTINEIVTNEITETACGSFEWNGTTYDASGDYDQTFTAENGCDSIVTLHLTINEIVTNEITETACGSFEWNGTTYDVSGDYSETFTAVNGCDSIVTLHLTINELPTVEITQEGEILSATAGMETYAWNTNETTESITISATGNYSVTVTNAAGCESTADIEVTEIPTTGINEIAVSKIAVYPNPNNGEFTINLGGIDNAISYQVIDAKGAIVKEAKVNSNEEFVSIQAKAGNYTVKVITDSKVFVEQIIVQ